MNGDRVIYHHQQPRDERFWSNVTGWGSLAGATRFVTMPNATYPFGGPKNTQAAALCIGAMREFVVTLRDTEDGGSCRIEFECFAESEDHAIEQAEDAYPDDEVQAVFRTEALD